MRRIRLVIPIEPKGQMRARSRAVVRRGDGKAIAMTYKDPKQEKRELTLRELLYPHRPDVPFSGQIFLGVKAYFLVPRSKGKAFREKALNGLVRPTKKPDLSNIIKNIEDVCNEVIWRDDAKIVGYLPGTGKYFGEIARYEIEIVAMD